MAWAGEPVLRSRHRASQMSTRGRDGVETFVVAEQHQVLFRKRGFAARREFLRRAELESAHRSGQNRRTRKPKHSGRRGTQGGKEAPDRGQAQETASGDGGWI